ncbi:MAG: exodeoxyribonuclease VII small subunit [Oscillospiraceae bacterium]|jgi:exodeoxyribonuclease VII small subunit|nr:exodeoxyribonuclease VII small subunit [Oscillospiraceae bacterium]
MNQNNMTFEQSMQRLEQIVRAMERGDVALEESLKLFQEGTELVRNCNQLLDDAQLQVKKIMTAPDGSPVEEDFIDE